MVRLAKATAVILDQTLMYIAGQTCFRIVIVMMLMFLLNNVS